MTISDPILFTLRDLAQQHGVEVYVVGGYVRDVLMKRHRTDIDCTVVGDALEFSRHVAKHFGVKPVVYERFHTALIPLATYQLEFVGTRKEVYSSASRNPIVSTGTIEDDILRRDFTVNALAILLDEHLGSSEVSVLDLTGGLVDIQRQLLRTPLDPDVTFNDDPLRMLRAARFASQLQFSIDESSLSSMKKLASRLSIISQERITTEFMKILASPKPSIGLEILHNTGLLSLILPEVERLAGVDLAHDGNRQYAHKDVFYHTLKVVDNVAAMSDNVWLRFATLMHDIAKPKTKRFINGTGWTFHGHEEVGARWQSSIFKRMKLPLEHLPYVETLVRLHQRPMTLVDEEITDSAIRRLAVHAGEWLEDLFILCRSDITTQNESRAKRYLRNYEIVYTKICDVRERDNLSSFQSPVRGEEIMAICQIPPSRSVGYIKHAIEEAILDGIIPNEYESAKDYLILHKDQWMLDAQTKNMGLRQEST